MSIKRVVLAYLRGLRGALRSATQRYAARGTVPDSGGPAYSQRSAGAFI